MNTRTAPKDRSVPRRDIRRGFVHERVPHIDAEIDVIWQNWKPKVDDALASLNGALKGHAALFKMTSGGRAGKAIDFCATETMPVPSDGDVLAGALPGWEIPSEAPEFRLPIPYPSRHPANLWSA